MTLQWNPIVVPSVDSRVRTAIAYYGANPSAAFPDREPPPRVMDSRDLAAWWNWMFHLRWRVAISTWSERERTRALLAKAEASGWERLYEPPSEARIERWRWKAAVRNAWRQP